MPHPEGGQQPGQRLGLPAAAFGEPAVGVHALPGPAVHRLSMPDHQQCRPGGAPQRFGHRRHIVGIAEFGDRLLDRPPLHPVCLGIVVSLPVVCQFPSPPGDHLGARGDRIADGGQLPAEPDPETRLLQHLTNRGDRQILIRFDLPLGQAPIVVPGPMDDQQLAGRVRAAQHHRPRSIDLATGTGHLNACAW